MKNSPTLTYKDAGVDIDAGNRMVEQIKSITRATRRREVLANIGGFGGLFALPPDKYKQPVLVSGTDGVGTKLKLAQTLRKHDTIGIDLVAMCVNDIVVSGAEPLFFLDYFATGKLDPDHATEVISGIGAGCQQAGCALIGGETAEMPGMYQNEDYDLAGFCVGVVEKEKLIDGSRIQAGNVILGLASSGPHSNGYSLIRKIIELNNIDLEVPFNNSTLGQTLLEPTKIYVKSLLELINHHEILGLAHITGGGLIENIPRILPENTKAVINTQSWEWPKIFKWLQKEGNILNSEMYRTFNCGIGMICVVPADTALLIQHALTELGETCWQIGKIASCHPSEEPITLWPNP